MKVKHAYSMAHCRLNQAVTPPPIKGLDLMGLTLVSFLNPGDQGACAKVLFTGSWFDPSGPNLIPAYLLVGLPCILVPTSLLTESVSSLISSSILLESGHRLGCWPPCPAGGCGPGFLGQT